MLSFGDVNAGSSGSGIRGNDGVLSDSGVVFGRRLLAAIGVRKILVTLAMAARTQAGLQWSCWLKLHTAGLL